MDTNCENDSNLPTFGGFFAGLLTGGLVGFGVMMLFAPRSGQMTRDQIGQKSIELQGRVSDTYEGLVTLSHFDNRKILSGTRRNDDVR